MSNPSKKTDNKNSAKKQLDLYSYTGKVKFFDKDKGFGYIQEIPDTKNLDNVVKEWRITAEQLGNTIIHRGDFVYFMKHGKTIGEISIKNCTIGVYDLYPISLRAFDTATIEYCNIKTNDKRAAMFISTSKKVEVRDNKLEIESTVLSSTDRNKKDYTPIQVTDCQDQRVMRNQIDKK